MNSRNKGKVGEREFAALLREHGFDARRGQQFSGSPESPDVVSEALAWLHIEVKRVQHLNLMDACAQAEGDCGGKPWVVAHRRNHAPWLITLRAETFFQLLRGELPPGDGTDGTQGTDGHGFIQPRKNAEGAKEFNREIREPRESEPAGTARPTLTQIAPRDVSTTPTA
jgi:hypothetical protein